MWQALGSPGQHRGASEGRALGPKSLRVTNGKGKGALRLISISRVQVRRPNIMLRSSIAHLRKARLFSSKAVATEKRALRKTDAFRKKSVSAFTSRNLFIGGIGLSAAGVWLGLDEGEWSAKIRKTLYDSPLGDFFKLVKVNKRFKMNKQTG